jgi:hypothetical protein
MAVADWSLEARPGQSTGMWPTRQTSIPNSPSSPSESDAGKNLVPGLSCAKAQKLAQIFAKSAGKTRCWSAVHDENGPVGIGAPSWLKVFSRGMPAIISKTG